MTAYAAYVLVRCPAEQYVANSMAALSAYAAGEWSTCMHVQDSVQCVIRVDNALPTRCGEQVQACVGHVHAMPMCVCRQSGGKYRIV